MKMEIPMKENGIIEKKKEYLYIIIRKKKFQLKNYIEVINLLEI